MENDDVIKRLKNLADRNPDLLDVLEKEFPEIAGEFVKTGMYFTRKAYDNLYVLLYNHGTFRVFNTSEGVYWNSEQKPSNPFASSSKDYYLTKSDFNELIKKSGVSLRGINIICPKKMHNFIVNNK
tara:strand:+ start:172 stop:549 length:378 start_codon:yes stop_codon:yes gene_type:complete